MHAWKESGVQGVLFCIFLLLTSTSCRGPQSLDAPDFIILDKNCLDQLKHQLTSGTLDSHPAYQQLIIEADEALSQQPLSVVYKERVPPSGDKHDYMSQGPYWWPDTTKPDGLPYVRRDGEENPERRSFRDREQFSQLMEVSDQLAKAYYLTGAEKYAEKAVSLLRTWFMDDETRMNPHLMFGQSIPGRTEGRGIGIIETRRIAKILDAVEILRLSESWSPEDELLMQAWCTAYLFWLLNSDHGQDEAVHPNNHGTWYDVQTAALAIFTERDSIAEQLVELAKQRRLEEHISADGSQPRELARTRSWDYSTMNLWGLFQLAQVGAKIGQPLWNYPDANSSKLRSALDYLLPFALGQEEWPHEQIRPFDATRLIPHLKIAKQVYSDSTYSQALEQLQEDHPDPTDDWCLP